MKNILSLILLLITASSSAQWSNTSNQFFDSLHMPVSRVLQVQANPIVLKSYPDSGYFVIWQDERNMSTTKIDIYAQKYDKAGNRLWAENGIPAVNGPNAQFYAFSSNQDYRNRSFAATDSAGGFYICYTDDSVTNYSWPRMAVQHIKSDGSQTFPGAGYIISYTPSGQSYSLWAPFLIPDGHKGFFISFSRNYLGSSNIFVYNYKDENGIMKYYGGGWVNENAIQRSQVSPCGIREFLEYPGTNVSDYHIWPDGQGGCNVIMSMSGNTSGQGPMLAYNRIWRAKKDARVKTLYRNTTGVACPRFTAYKKDSVYLLYKLDKNIITTSCGTVSGNNVYVVTSERLTSNGYLLIDIGGYDYHYPKGTTVFTNGNINVDAIAVTRRTYSNNTVSDFTVQGYFYKSEKFDSIPYQRTAHNNPDFGYNFNEPQGLNKINFVRDTLLASANYYPDFSLSSGSNLIYAAGLMSGISGQRNVRLQSLLVNRITADSFAIQYRAPEPGEIIGRELSTGFSGSNIGYDLPIVTVTPSGNALFSIQEYGRSTRISPVSAGVQLTWGAMGRAIGSGAYKNAYYSADQPDLALDPRNGTGLIAWRDSRYIPPTNTSSDIYMRHINKLFDPNYTPPLRPVKLLPNPYGATPANPAVLMGTSGVFTPFEVTSISFEPSTTTIAEIDDDYNFGRIQMALYQHSGAVRTYNNRPYLSRNWHIVPETMPAGAITGLRLFFTTAEFNALKAADNTIETPADLMVIQQANSTTTTPAAYVPATGEKTLSPFLFDSVPGGYFVQLNTTAFGNFYLFKGSDAAICPGGSTTIAAGLTGSSYQWQKDIGMGYYNVVADANHSGINTATLQLTNMQSSWYGHKYRCVVDGVHGNMYTLRFLNNWTGTTSNDWNNGANWSCGTVPDANTDVIINSGTVVLTGNGICRTLKVNPGASVKVNAGYTLTVTK